MSESKESRIVSAIVLFGGGGFVALCLLVAAFFTVRDWLTPSEGPGSQAASVPAIDAVKETALAYFKPADEPKVIVDSLDAPAIAARAGLSKPEESLSGNGRKRLRWRFGEESEELESIGNVQADADVLGWSCSDWDSEGNAVRPVLVTSRCGQFFQKVLGGVVERPDLLASQMLAQNARTGRNVLVRAPPFIVESDGAFYFVRRRD